MYIVAREYIGGILPSDEELIKLNGMKRSKQISLPQKGDYYDFLEKEVITFEKSVKECGILNFSLSGQMKIMKK